GGEGGASPAEQAGLLDQLHQLVTGHSQRLAGRLVTAGGSVALQGVRIRGVFHHPLGDDQRRGRDRRSGHERSLRTVPSGWKAGYGPTAPPPDGIAQSKLRRPPNNSCISSGSTTSGVVLRSQATSSRAFSGVIPSISS